MVHLETITLENVGDAHGLDHQRCSKEMEKEVFMRATAVKSWNMAMK